MFYFRLRFRTLEFDTSRTEQPREHGRGVNVLYKQLSYIPIISILIVYIGKVR